MKDDALFLDIAKVRVYRKVDFSYVGLMSIPVTFTWTLGNYWIRYSC